jgi:hypothetical protein
MHPRYIPTSNGLRTTIADAIHPTTTAYAATTQRVRHSLHTLIALSEYPLSLVYYSPGRGFPTDYDRFSVSSSPCTSNSLGDLIDARPREL